MEFLASTELIVRLGCFVSAFTLFASLEAWFPRRSIATRRIHRWPSNIGVSALNQLFVRLIVPVSAIALAATAEKNGWGLLGQVELPVLVEIAVAILILDLAIYLQHLLYHLVPVLWRFHRMHHADTELDVTTGIRFHPASVLLSAFIKLTVIFVVGPAVVAVLVFEVLLNATSIFNHSNLRIPPSVERILRLLIVTPDMHRVHHSTKSDENNRNFGFNFPWWDWLFLTYRAEPDLGHREMKVGLDEFRDERELRLDRMITQPFRKG